MATAAIGKLGYFDEGVETWEAYSERLEQYFIANGIEGDKKVPALLSVIGPKTYALLKTLVAPAKPFTKTFAQLTEQLDKHLNPKTLVIAEIFPLSKARPKPQRRCTPVLSRTT